jgi:hypothetical protein
MVVFNQTNTNPIVICIIDNRDLYQSGWATEVSINISDFLVHRFATKGYDIFIGKDEDELLTFASSQEYSHAVVIAMGMSLGLSDRIFPAIEKICKQDFFVAGHILERNEQSYWKNGYYELHHQFYIVQLEDYKQLGFPSIGKQQDIPHIQTEPLRSTECLYNDHEVAAWIKPGTTNKEYAMKCHGWNIISTALAHNKTIIDLGEDIRNNKKYLYYEHDHVFLRMMSDIYHNQFFCNNFYASWNSDQFKDHIPFDGPVEQYITVGIGVYWITYLERIGITPNTKVIFTDINHNTLQFMKAMVEEWDGTNYAEFYRAHLPIIPVGTYNDIDAYIEYTKKEWESFISKHDNWQELWAKIKSLKFEYVLIDYMSTYDLNWIEPNKRTLLNLSDVFTHSPYTATQSLKYRVTCENKLINKLKQIDPNINVMMTSRSADGYYPVQQVSNGPISSFDLTDINLLKKTPWHSTDWHSPRMLG